MPLCQFVEYDQRAHRLHTLASFSFWVQSMQRPSHQCKCLLTQEPDTSPFSHPSSPSPAFRLSSPPKIRVASAQSLDSRVSVTDPEEPSSPIILANDVTPMSQTPVPLPVVRETVKVDIPCPRPGEDVTVADDGPVFRATIKALEQKTGNMRVQMKKVLRKAESAYTAQLEANDALGQFIDALREASSTNANAVQPAVEHYFDKISREIISYERQNTINLHKMIIDPLAKLYSLDLKQAETKKREFEEESKDYYAYVSRYLGQRHDSVKAKKLAESDSKYQSKRRTFELKRFDYSSFVQDLHGGRKEQEVLSHLTKYADAQTKIFLSTAKKVEELLPQLEALASEVQEADKEYQYQRREREEKRRLIEKGNIAFSEEPIPPPTAHGNPNGMAGASDSDLNRANSTGSTLRAVPGGTPATPAAEISRSPGSLGSAQSPVQTSKFRGIRDLEERDSLGGSADSKTAHRKEGLLWSSRLPGSHVDPRNLNKQMHKYVISVYLTICFMILRFFLFFFFLRRFWIVLDQGKLSEYSNWKQKLDLHMEPIDLRMASVREARDSDRRFCFEVITPHFKRVYQATSEEDMHSWINAINNALQSAVEGRGLKDRPAPMSGDSSLGRDIGSVLTGKSNNSHSSGSGVPARRITVGGPRPASHRSTSGSFDDNPDKLLQMLRDNDQGNCWCADCGSPSKVEWVSINLAIILCIECSGIHRSLGTHISKVRSLTLDITSFTADIVELLMLVGNRVSNMIWEAKLDAGIKPTPQASREQRFKFITNKYVDRLYVEPLSPAFKTPDELLLTAIKKNAIQQVIRAVSLRANPNVADRSRDTPALYLALAAADPASPSPTPPGMRSEQANEKAVPFPVAEMLVQNGATIPDTMPAFPLSRSAQQYVESKRVRAAAIDNVGSLPGAGNSVLSAADRLQREKEARLQKRVSAGGRLAKASIPER